MSERACHLAGIDDFLAHFYVSLWDRRVRVRDYLPPDIARATRRTRFLRRKDYSGGSFAKKHLLCVFQVRAVLGFVKGVPGK